jgi:hypothetical protein
MQNLFLYSRDNEEEEIGTEIDIPAETEEEEEEDFSDFVNNEE